ncbi:hypothetical protein Rt10032_c14g5352 [Rhodotorula toruloides]|uniref:Uncharacterized protein n=1 Tax=Rhodotorula toruloides TaxID=5286 RepID=A0A511KN56_RHOTO|nr:hypothetical protein Rt10032_c14g5352 [Rhodotorula toruloides]
MVVVVLGSLQLAEKGSKMAEQLIPVLVQLYHPHPRTLSLALPSSTTLASLPLLLDEYCPTAQQRLSYASGRSLPRLSSTARVSSLAGARKDEGGFVTLRLGVRLPGGKGGFASQLRAQGGRMSSNKAQNTDSCRSLDGRRLSTIKEAQKLAKLLESEPDRLAAAALAKQQKLDELNAEIKRLEQQAGIDAVQSGAVEASGSGSAPSTSGAGGGGNKRKLDAHYVEESREIVSGVKDAVKAAMLKKRKKIKASAPTDIATASGDAMKATGSSGSEGEKEDVIKEQPKTDPKGKGKAKAVEED